MADKVYPPTASHTNVLDVETKTIIHASAPRCVPVHACIMTSIFVGLFIFVLLLTAVIAAAAVIAWMLYNNTFAIDLQLVFDIFSKTVLTVFFIVPGVICVAVILAGITISSDK